MLTKLGYLIFITILFKANVGAYETDIPKEKCFSFKIKTDSFFRVSIGVDNDDKSHNTSFYLYLGYKYVEKPTERFSGLYDTVEKKYAVFDQVTTDLLSPNEYTEFWLKFHNNVFQIGVKSNPKPFMEHKYLADLNRIKITPGESNQVEDLVIPASFECPYVVRETIVNLGVSGSFMMPAPKDKCLTFKIKTEPFFRVFFGKINDNYALNASFYAYIGYKYGGKTGQYSGLYDPLLKKYMVYDKMTPDLLSDKSYQEFFIKCDNNEFKIGLLNDSEPLMTHKFDGNAEDNYIQIAPDNQKAVLIFNGNNAVCPGDSTV